MERIQREKNDWWGSVSNEDKKAINEGLEQLNKGEDMILSQVRKKIKAKYNL
ncbi:hypothetical protein [Anaerophaga thermohalophila]|jgi:hypothetical protein|uniref:hypothetical protein n=1 Tax=Anaerophaga thermohalophila TaxID=177400 RepID=UPI0002D5B96C|nr:hypothetical protein [Anaerophaga thermohalophila]